MFPPRGSGHQLHQFKETAPHESARRIPKTSSRLHADGQVCARPIEQGHVESDGREMASMCRIGQKAKLIGALHLSFAALLFLTLAYFSLALFTKTAPDKTLTRRKLQRNAVYRVCGYTILVSIFLMVVVALPEVKTLVERLTPVFWLESVAVVAFGVSWLVKGETILKDQET